MPESLPSLCTHVSPTYQHNRLPHCLHSYSPLYFGNTSSALTCLYLNLSLSLILCVVYAGRLVEVYDELGNRYVVPRYCISNPVNMAGPLSTAVVPNHTQRLNTARQLEESEESDSTALLLNYSNSEPGSHSSSAAAHEVHRRGRTGSLENGGGKRRARIKKRGHSLQTEGAERGKVPVGDPVMIKIRVSTITKDIKMTIQASDRVRDVKRRLEAEHNVSAPHVTMLYSGRVLRDGVYIKNLDIPNGYIIQAIVT